MNPTHCSCGYEFADKMRFCPYCGHRRKLAAIVVRCTETMSCQEHEMMDNCSCCAPWWDAFPVCPITGNKIAKSGHCRECKQYHELPIEVRK